MGGSISQEQETKKQIESVAWFFNKYSLPKEEYKELYEEYLHVEKGKSVPEFESFWDVLVNILSKHGEEDEEFEDRFWNQYQTFIEIKHSKIRKSLLLLIHYDFMDLILKNYNIFINTAYKLDTYCDHLSCHGIV
jgi:hypothetical protein